MSFAMFKKHKRTPTELATKLNNALDNLAKGGAEKVRPCAVHDSTCFSFFSLPLLRAFHVSFTSLLSFPRPTA